MKNISLHAPLNNTNRNWERALLKTIKSSAAAESEYSDLFEALNISSFDELPNITSSDKVYYDEHGYRHYYFLVTDEQFTNSTKWTPGPLVYEYTDPQYGDLGLQYYILRKEDGGYVAYIDAQI